MASELDYKRKFAEYLAEGCAPLEAAMRTFKPDGYTNAAFLLWVSREWPKDEDVNKLKLEIDNNTTSETKYRSFLWDQSKRTAGTREGPQYARLLGESYGYLGGTNSKSGKNGAEGADKLASLMEMLGP